MVCKEVESATMSLRQSFRTSWTDSQLRQTQIREKQILQDEYLPALAEEMPDIPIIKSMTIFGVRSNVKGLEYTSGADYIFTNVTKE